jgi:hypothetical protein
VVNDVNVGKADRRHLARKRRKPGVGVGVGAHVVERAVRSHSQADAIPSDTCRRPTRDLHGEADPVLDAAAPAVGAVVDGGGEELLEEVAVAKGDFHTVQPGFDQVTGDVGVGGDDLFDLAFARLLDIELARFRPAFYERGARAVALSCRAAGIDRSVFPTVFNLSRQARGLPVVLAAAEIQAADAIFAGFTRQSAMAELHAALLQ